jgi:antitoxin component of RelBE/YafQ-DinJ toxin-antitoxin module
MAHITSINVRVDDDTKNRIAAIAAYREITISDLVREWYADCLE